MPPHDPRIDELLKQVKDLAHQNSLKKNGESWPAYIGKIVTPERAMLAVMMVWQFGGEWRDMKVKVDEQLVQVDTLAATVRAREETAKQLALDTQATTDDLRSDMAELSKATKGLEDRVSRTITRSEFNAAINTGIVPRLASIEKRLASAAVYSGEQRK
jgi:hypothetical protein